MTAMVRQEDLVFKGSREWAGALWAVWELRALLLVYLLCLGFEFYPFRQNDQHQHFTNPVEPHK